jgi:hypothetical protein
MLARGFSRVESKPDAAASNKQKCVTEVRDKCAFVMIMNFSEEELVPNSTILGIAGVKEEWVNQINSDCETNPNPINGGWGERKNNFLYKKLLRGKLDHLPEEDRWLTEPVLHKYAHVFHDEQSNDFKGTDVAEHQILLEDPRPMRRPQYRVPYTLRKVMKSQVDDMLRKGITRESSSPGFTPAILVPKKSSDGHLKFRFCVDFRALNAVIKFTLTRYQSSTKQPQRCMALNILAS